MYYNEVLYISVSYINNNTHEYYSTMRKKGILQLAAIWMDFKGRQRQSLIFEI